MFRFCQVPGCNKSTKGSSPKVGMCGMHYARFKRNGHTELTRRQNGTGNINAGGYIEGRMVAGRRTYEHILVAEKALGKRLPKGAEVHHVNEIRTDNRPENLVICPGAGYHRLLHRRMEARDACGNPNWVKCSVCKQYDDPVNLSNRKQHPECQKARDRKRYEKSKEARNAK